MVLHTRKTTNVPKARFYMSVELCENTAILHPIHAQLESEIGRLDFHVQFKVQVVLLVHVSSGSQSTSINTSDPYKFYAFRCSQPREESARNFVQICCERADSDQTLVEGVRGDIVFTAD